MKQCPLEDSYKFRTKCRVTTCKMFNEQTACNCLALDTTFASNEKTLSDAELIIYKFPGKNQREVASIRKRAVSRVSAVLALNNLVQHIRQHEKPETGLNAAFMRRLPGDAKQLLKKSFRSKIFKIKHLDLEVWMLPFVLDPEYANKIVPDFNRFAIHLLFRWVPKELEIVTRSINEVRKLHRVDRIQAKIHPDHRQPG